MQTYIIKRCSNCSRRFKSKRSKTGYSCEAWGVDDFACDTILEGYCHKFKVLPELDSPDSVFGIDFQRCIDCERARANPLRDDLLVTAGTRAAYMSVYENIILPDSIDGESELAKFIADVVDYYLNNETDTCFDDYIEQKLIDKYGI